MLPSYDTDVVTVVFRKLVSLPTATHSSEGQAINTKLFYIIFLAIRIKYMFHKHHSHPKTKVPKSINGIFTKIFTPNSTLSGNMINLNGQNIGVITNNYPLIRGP
ncbi:hypothetical protein TYRP_016727 [Tyrophagus putrescentiae]|nr:hypothetical protein TYRP_016727 [Tyrophagus putrescentiae]